METLSRQASSQAIRTQVSTDVVVFTIRRASLHVLCRGAAEPLWTLPAGLVETEETLDACATRVLSSQAGLTGVYMEQLYSLGPVAAPDGRADDCIVTVAYFSIVPLDRATDPGDAIGWFPVSELPDLSASQAQIVALAQQRLRAKLDYSTIAFEFMPSEFTLSELQNVYEIVLATNLDKRNFRKRILGLDLLEDTGDKRRSGSHRPARLFRYRSNGEVQYIK